MSKLPFARRRDQFDHGILVCDFRSLGGREAIGFKRTGTSLRPDCDEKNVYKNLPVFCPTISGMDMTGKGHFPVWT